MNVFRIADLLVSHVVKTHPNEVDLIAYYGSHAMGTASHTSDLDIFYIPRDGTNPPINRAFLVEGILFDFWPIPWATMEGFATGQIRGWANAPSLVYHAKVLHARSDEQRAQLASLKQKVLDLQKPEARPWMIQRALDMFQCVQGHLGNLRLAICAGDDFADIRHAGWCLINQIWECLALANQTLCDRSKPSIPGAADCFPCKPPDLEQLIATIGTSNNPAEIVTAAEGLALGTRQVLRRFQQSLPSHATNPQEHLRQAYPEINDQIGKVIRACEGQNPVAASAAAWFAQYDLSSLLSGLRTGSGNHPRFNLYSECAGLYREIGLPELMQADFSDFSALANQARALDKRIRQLLQSHGVHLHEFSTLEEFETSL